jgi:CRISPR/Cas system CMR subunit Cmr6 (Cas7 group RAMP superfamily)
LGRFLLACLELALPVLHPAFGLPTVPGAILTGTATNTAQRIVAAGTIAKIVRNSFAA